MEKRQEFTKAVKVAIVKRATKDAVVYCEGCGGLARKWQIDHIIATKLQTGAKRKPLTAKDGQLLCLPCHKEKTKGDVGGIAKAKRVEAKHLGVKAAVGKKIESAGFAPKPEKHNATTDKTKIGTGRWYCPLRKQWFDY
jgi:hypothetical protein